MKTLLTLLVAAGFSLRLDAAPTSILFRTEFAENGSVADVSATLVSKDADGFSSTKDLKASTLPDAPRAQFAALQAVLSASASAGGWRLTGGELAQTGSTSDFQEVLPEGAAPSAPLVRVPIAGTERAVLTLWMTQQRDGKTRYQTITSESWPSEIRAAVLALWQWIQTSQP